MGHHAESALGQSPATTFNPYLEGAMSYPGQYGLYPHHFSKLRGPGGPHHDLNAYGDYPAKPQQAVPTYKWMQVKRNVPKPGIGGIVFFYSPPRPRFYSNIQCGSAAPQTALCEGPAGPRLEPGTGGLEAGGLTNPKINQ